MLPWIRQIMSGHPDLAQQRRSNGQRFTARVVITPRRDSLGKAIGYLLISKDISAEIRLTEELKVTQFYARSLIDLTERKLAEVQRRADGDPAEDEARPIAV